MRNCEIVRKTKTYVINKIINKFAEISVEQTESLFVASIITLYYIIT